MNNKLKLFFLLSYSILLSQNNCINFCIQQNNDPSYCERKCRAMLIDSNDYYYNYYNKNKDNQYNLKHNNPKQPQPNYDYKPSAPPNIRKYHNR